MSQIISALGKESSMKVDTEKELSAKVRHDTITIYLLKAQNRRLKKLEEANRRLRKYNGELRYALMKARAQNPVIQIPDSGRDGQLFSNEFVKEVNQTLQKSDAVAFNSVVMDLVFKKLDIKNIKNCRFVCKNWNEKAIRIMSRQNGGYSLTVCVDYPDSEDMDQIFPFIDNSLCRLRSVVTSAHQDWFRKAILDCSFSRSYTFYCILRNIGYRLRSIDIVDFYFPFKDLHEILVDCCPNLEQLALPPYLRKGHYYEDRMLVVEGVRELVFKRPLKLTDLFMQEQFCISIVKASPELKTLKCDSDMNSFQFFKELLTCPEITRNLEDVTVLNVGEVERQNQTIEVFNSIEFSSKLKKLAIHAVGHFQANQLTAALKKMDETLERLVLFVTYITDSNPTDPELIFPEMNNLSELRYLTSTLISITSIDFLLCMSNLKTLYLGGLFDQAIEKHGSKFIIDPLFSDCEQLRRKPRKMLKELYLFGIVRSPSHTFEVINTIFPNLTKLVVGVSVLNTERRHDYLNEFYETLFSGGIAKMTNLRDLYLDFRRPTPQDQEQFDYLSVVVGQINKLSNLNYLTIRDNSNSSTALVGDKLVEIPNLQRVTLIGLKIELLTAKELTLLLYKHDIHLEIKGNDVGEEFRVHLEERHTLRNAEFCF